MSNLSDLLPAGASAKQITATDSGSGIASKKPVILNSDGTVTEVSSSTVTANVGSITPFNSDASTWCATAAGSGSTNLVAYVDSGASSYGTAQVGTISGTGVTFGTKAVFESASVTGIQIAYSSSLDKYLIVYRDNGNSFYGTAVVATVSGTNVTFGTPVAFSARTTYAYDVVYDDSAGAFLIQYGNNDDIFARACTVSGTVPTFGGEITAWYTGTAYTCALGYDSTAGQSVGAWRYYTGTQAIAMVYSLSSTTITISTPVVYASGNGNTGGDAKISYNVKENRIVIGYKEGAGTSGTAIAGVLSGSGTGSTITFGTAVQFNASSSGSITCDYDATVARTIIGYLDAGAAEYPKAIPVTLSGSTITFPDSASTLQSAAAMNLSASYNGTEGKMLFSWIDTSVVGDSVVFTSPGTVENLTAQAFVGVADSAISASAAGSIIVQGGTVSGPTTSVAVAENIGANIPWGDQTKANYTSRAAYGSDDVLIAYSINDGVTVGARVVAGTIGGGTISFGTDAVISADASVSTSRYTVVYDSTNDTYIVSWLDAGDSYKMYAAVVSLTGNSISFGGTTAIVTTANASNFGGTSSVYDPDTQRVIFTYCSTVDNYAYAVVCEVSSTAITTVGTPAKIDSSSANNGYANRVSVCYDTTENKVIASYSYLGGGGTYYLRAAAGTVTGGVSNSITWGSSVPVISGEGTFISSAYNATDQRVVFSYQSATLTGYLNSSVASVSGTTITVGGTVSVITTGTNYYSSVAHDATANKMVTYYRGAGGPFVASGAINTATNTITYSTPTQLLSGTRNFEDTLYDPTTEKCILISSGASAGQTSCNIYTTAATLTGQPLTTGTKYYVTTSGGFSSSAGSPSVNAGLAISTTSLLLNGDS